MQTTPDRRQNRLIKHMLDASFYDHPVDVVELIETHISWIFLAGDFAYKVKKPVNFGFLDFSTLDKRGHFCREELHLNRRFAPALYLEVITIGGDPDEPLLHHLPVLEYAVKMRRFPQRQQLDRMLAAGKLAGTHLDEFAAALAGIHARAPVAQQSDDFGTPEAVLDPILQNFRQISEQLPLSAMKQPLAQLENWSRETYARLRNRLAQRKSDGFVRECHGDIHLGNMVRFDNSTLLFDCIEFNAGLRWIDTMNDIAFLVMDLDDHGEQVLGWRFLNRYLEESGDYPGLPLLEFYKVYRALVRAKVICLRLAQPGLSRAERTADIELASGYLDLARSYTVPGQPLLIITHGLSGAGKTSFVTQLAPLCSGICLHSDRERKRLFRLAPTAASHSPTGGGIYSAAGGVKTYTRLHDLAGLLLQAGITAIVDATCIKKADRKLFTRLAQRHGSRLAVLDFNLPEEELRRRVRQRHGRGKAVSEADEAVLDHQLAVAEPLNATEKDQAIAITAATDPGQIAAQLARMTTAAP